jgi:hypothetical protein
METNLIDFDYIPATSVINNSSPSYYDLESQIGEQNKKIESLEKTVGKMQDLIDELSKPQDPNISLLEMRSILYGMNEDMNILKTMHNNFCIQINYIDYKPEYVTTAYPPIRVGSSGNGGLVAYDKTLGFKTMTIPIMCEELDLSNMILENFCIERLINLCNLKRIIIREYTYSRHSENTTRRIGAPNNTSKEIKDNEVALYIDHFPDSNRPSIKIDDVIYCKNMHYFREPPKIVVLKI